MSKPIRQGDVLLTACDAVTAAQIRNWGKTGLARTVRRVKDLGLILAEGEVTGHHHRVSTKGVKMYEVKGVLYLDVPKGTVAELEHDEHETLQIPPGLHKIGGQREYVAPANPSQSARQSRVFD